MRTDIKRKKYSHISLVTLKNDKLKRFIRELRHKNKNLFAFSKFIESQINIHHTIIIFTFSRMPEYLLLNGCQLCCIIFEVFKTALNSNIHNVLIARKPEQIRQF